MEKIWDPLRKKEVALTPEEKVRQWFIAVLSDSCGVPSALMMSEAPLKYGEKNYRADILVYDRSLRPLAVVECKRPEVPVSREVLDQAMRYDIVLGVSYLFVTNGSSSFAFKLVGDSFIPIPSIPKYEEMLCRL